MPVEDLVTHPNNPRSGNVELISDSLHHNGFYGALVAQRSTRHVLAGNHRLLAARAQGMTHVPVTWVDVDDAQALRILLVDNRSNDVASYDTAALADLLRGLDDPTGTGYTAADIEALVALPPGLDELAAQYGEPAEGDLWPVLRFKVPPPVRDDFYALTEGCSDPNDDSARFQHLIQRMRAES